MLDPHRIEHTPRNELTKEILDKFSKREVRLSELEYVVFGAEFVTDESLRPGIQEVCDYLHEVFPLHDT